MDVLVDRDRAGVVESEIGRCRDAVRPRTTLPGSPRQEQVVNFRTLAPGRSGPREIAKGNEEGRFPREDGGVDSGESSIWVIPLEVDATAQRLGQAGHLLPSLWIVVDIAVALPVSY